MVFSGSGIIPKPTDPGTVHPSRHLYKTFFHPHTYKKKNIFITKQFTQSVDIRILILIRYVQLHEKERFTILFHTAPVRETEVLTKQMELFPVYGTFYMISISIQFTFPFCFSIANIRPCLLYTSRCV